MVRMIEIKREIGRLIELHQNTADVNQNFDFNDGEKDAVIYFLKSSNCKSISIRVETAGLTYRFTYPNTLNGKFDMYKLVPM